MTEEQIKQKAEEYVMREDVITENDRVPFDNGYGFQTVSFEDEVKQAFIDGYHEGFKDCAKARLNVTTISDCPNKDEEESKYKTAYIKGIRTMANALKDYDRTDGAWTDYFEHTVEEVLNRLLKENE